MKKTFLLISLFICLFIYPSGNMNTSVINTQNNNIKGTIIDNKNNEILCGVKIKLTDKYNNSYITYTNLEGNFSFNINEDIEYTISVDYISYKSEEIKISTSKKDIDIRMNKL